jgi:hypothetical protein
MTGLDLPFTAHTRQLQAAVLEESPERIGFSYTYICLQVLRTHRI